MVNKEDLMIRVSTAMACSLLPWSPHAFKANERVIALVACSNNVDITLSKSDIRWLSLPSIP